MMRSFGNRPDTYVSDEPFYAHYLDNTEFDHPVRDQVIEVHDSRWESVVSHLTGAIPEGKSVWYQKQMAHHMLPQIDREWLFDNRFVHAFLIREPQEMLTSLFKILGKVEIHQTGYPQQLEIFRRLTSQSGSADATSAIVVDSKDILNNPEKMLRKLCVRLGLEFTPQMLRWEKGPRATDGVWGKHWYSSVYETTGFGIYKPKNETIDESDQQLLHDCQEIYDELAAHRIQV